MSAPVARFEDTSPPARYRLPLIMPNTNMPDVAYARYLHRVMRA